MKIVLDFLTSSTLGFLLKIFTRFPRAELPLRVPLLIRVSCANSQTQTIEQFSLLCDKSSIADETN